MQQQAGAAQLCLNVQPAALLPGRHEIQDVRVRTQALVVPGFPHAAVPLAAPPEAMSGALDSILAPVLVVLHLQKHTVHLSAKQLLKKGHFISFIDTYKALVRLTLYTSPKDPRPKRPKLVKH